MDNFGLSEKLTLQLVQVFNEFQNLNSVILYGSRANGTHSYNSDVDLTLVGPLLTTTDLLKIENSIDDLMSPYTFDISILHHINNKSLVEHISKAGKRIYNKS